MDFRSLVTGFKCVSTQSDVDCLGDGSKSVFYCAVEGRVLNLAFTKQLFAAFYLYLRGFQMQALEEATLIIGIAPAASYMNCHYGPLALRLLPL